MGASLLLTGSLLALLIGIMALTMVLPVILLAISGTLLGTYYAWQTSASVSDYRQHLWHIAVGTTPSGWLGMIWAVLVGIAHRADRLRQVYKIVRYVTVFGLVTMGMSVLMALLSLLSLADFNRNPEANQQIVLVVIPFFVIFVVLYFDFVQAVVLGGLIGMIAGNSTRDALDARLRASALFVMAQFATYALSFFSLITIHLISTQLLTNLLSQSLLDALIFIFSFFLVRESLISILVRLLLWQTNSSPYDWMHLIQS